MKPGFFVVCTQDGIDSQAFGPFDTRAEAIAELEVTQQNHITRCNLDHLITPAHKVATTIACYPPRTTPIERERQVARSAATRHSR